MFSELYLNKAENPFTLVLSCFRAVFSTTGSAAALFLAEQLLPVIYP